MSEEIAISSMQYPNTVASLKKDLEKLGIYGGMTVLVHSSLSKIGWVCGGAVAVIQALTQVVTPEGTLIMPAHSGDLSNPARWAHPPVPEDWWQLIRDTMPAFETHLTPTRGMGTIAELFRTLPDVKRSYHPAVSFAAWGKHADDVVADHSLSHSLGSQSPLGKLYEMNGHVLLLGVGFGNNTSFHLSEDLVDQRKLYTEGSPILENGSRVWKWYEETDWDDETFPQIGADFEKTGQVKISRVGLAETRLFLQRPAVEFAVDWLNRHHQAC